MDWRWMRSGCLAIALAAAAGCQTLAVSGGPSWDTGTIAVGGIDSGIGGFLEVAGYRNAYAFGPGGALSLSLAGYDTDGDADPIGLVTAEGRYRRDFRPDDTGGAYWQVGTGIGVAWTPVPQAAAFPLLGEIGVEAVAGQFTLMGGIREKLHVLVGNGSPALDVLNSLQLRLGVALDLR